MTPEMETNHEPHRTGHRWVDWSVTACALFVSICSLALSIHHGNAMEQLVQANSQPFLQFGTSNSELRADGSLSAVFRWIVLNAGSGPARIEWTRMAFAGKPVVTNSDWLQTLKGLQGQAAAAGEPGESARVGDVVTADLPESYLKGGDQREFLRWPRTEANDKLWDIASQRIADVSKMEIVACYCSIFDECWIATNRAFKPRSVESCASDD